MHGVSTSIKQKLSLQKMGGSDNVTMESGFNQRAILRVQICYYR